MPLSREILGTGSGVKGLESREIETSSRWASRQGGRAAAHRGPDSRRGSPTLPTHLAGFETTIRFEKSVLVLSFLTPRLELTHLGDKKRAGYPQELPFFGLLNNA